MEINLGQYDFAFPIINYICGKEILTDDNFVKKSTEGYNWQPTPQQISPTVPSCFFLVEYDGTGRTEAEIFKRELLTPSQSHSSSSSDSSSDEDQFGNTPPRRRRRSVSSGGNDSGRGGRRVRNADSSESEEDWLTVVRKDRRRRSRSRGEPDSSSSSE